MLESILFHLKWLCLCLYLISPEIAENSCNVIDHITTRRQNPELTGTFFAVWKPQILHWTAYSESSQRDECILKTFVILKRKFFLVGESVFPLAQFLLEASEIESCRFCLMCLPSRSLYYRSNFTLSYLTNNLLTCHVSPVKGNLNFELAVLHFGFVRQNDSVLFVYEDSVLEIWILDLVRRERERMNECVLLSHLSICLL
jgi:hypothetical protein